MTSSASSVPGIDLDDLLTADEQADVLALYSSAVAELDPSYDGVESALRDVAYSCLESRLNGWVVGELADAGALDGLIDWLVNHV